MAFKLYILTKRCNNRRVKTQGDESVILPVRDVFVDFRERGRCFCRVKSYEYPASNEREVCPWLVVSGRS